MDPALILEAVAGAPVVAIAGYGSWRHGRATLARRDGFATSWAVSRRLSERAARRSGKQTRPALRRPHAYPAHHFGRHLGRSVRPEGGRPVYLTHEDVALVVAPPRAGKTKYVLAPQLLDAPGPVVATSTKHDLYTDTHALRAQRGPVWLLNPEAMDGLPSTLRWSPIPLCADPATAITTAAYMVSAASTGHGVEDASFWENKNAQVLRSLLYAAAVGGKSLLDVAGWITDARDRAPLRVLDEHPNTPPGWADVLRQIMTTPAEKTRESVYITLQQTVEFLADPAVAQIALPGSAEEAFDIDAFLEGSGTLYLLGAAKTHGGMGPFFAALTGLVFERAKQLSQASGHGRLDPPLSLFLDEVANICPVPLPQWVSDAGGRGIALTAAIQSPSQLEDRWGRSGRETVEQASAWIVLGGLTVKADLEAISGMLGERDEPTPRDRHPKAHREPAKIRRVPVLAPDEVRCLKDRRALLVWRNQRPVEVKLRPVWRRRDVRRHHRQQNKALRAAQRAPIAPYPDEPTEAQRLADVVQLQPPAPRQDEGGRS
ncbi:MAG: type IV secretory system conjugative DNA transfer family protein [Streptosporangiales bacterium]